MKMKLILNIAAVMALAVVTDSQGMFRRVPKVATAQAVAPKVAQRAFSFKGNKDFSMPQVPAAKINVSTIKRYQKLKDELAIESQAYNDAKSKLQKAVLKKTALLALPVLTGKALLTHPTDQVVANIFGASFIYSIFALPWQHSIKECIKDCLEIRTRQKSVENELMDLVAEQKRESKLRDDIQ